MAVIERDVVLQGKTASGDHTIDLPVTALRNIEGEANIKEKPASEDYIPIIDSTDDGQMKKILFQVIEELINAKMDKTGARLANNEYVVFQGAARSFIITPSGTLRMMLDKYNGNWQQSIGVIGNPDEGSELSDIIDNVLGCVGFRGTGNELQYVYIGKGYDDAWLKVYPDGRILGKDDVDILAGINSLANNGCKNLLINNFTKRTANGVTAVTNSDGSITLTGKNTLGSTFLIAFNLQTGAVASGSQYSNNKKWIPNGDYILSGGSANASVQIRLAVENNNEGVGYTSNGNETAFTITDVHKYVWCRLNIRKDADFGDEGETIYPMIRSANIKDDTYVPYTPSNYELYKMILALQSGQSTSISENMVSDESTGEIEI